MRLPREERAFIVAAIEIKVENDKKEANRSRAKSRR
jgi:hypothetical protein